MADVEQTVAAPETTVEETPKAEEAKSEETAAPAENGKIEENGHTNGHAEPAATETEEAPKDEAPAEETTEDKPDEEEPANDAEPATKKAKKSVEKPKKKITEGRRSSSRLQNVITGTLLSKEITSDNLPKGKGTR